MAERTGIILAGGASRRMGTPKAWVEVGGIPLIVRVVNQLRQVCDDLVIVANDFGPLQNVGARLVADIIPGKGSLGGIYSGLANAHAEYAFACACDMPFLNVDLIGRMFELAPDFDVVIPSVEEDHHTLPADKRRQRTDEPSAGAKRARAKDRHLHPLHAVYSRRCLEPMREAIARDDLRMISFHQSLRVRILKQSEFEEFDPLHLSVFNVNTPQDLLFAQGVVTQDSRV